VRSTSARGAAAAALAIAILAVATSAFAAKPGPGTSRGSAAVFVSNPVEDLNNQSLRDRKDSAAAVPAAAYHTVTLTDLDGSGFLRGRWATIVGETGNPAYSPTNSFFYNRSQDEFEQVMAYFWITESQKYIQRLGFGTGRFRPVNMESQRLRINQWGIDNSFATTHPKDEIRLGKGGVDDAEDGEVVVHEYGHAIHFSQNYAFASEEAGAMSEGFGDYWAVTTTMVVRDRLGLRPLRDPACVADWDATSYDPTAPHCLRRVDNDLHYPEDLVGQVHADGEIWSRALWDIRNAVGHVRGDTSILAGQFDFAGTTMTQLARRIVAAADRIYGAGTASRVRAQFVARGILS
jgi:zinc metalloprotease ZmpB